MELLKPGQIRTFRKFNELNDLLIYIRDFQNRLFIPEDHYCGSAYGIMKQFMGLEVPLTEKDQREVYVLFAEEDPTSVLASKIVLNALWFDKNTRKAVYSIPEWFNKKTKEYYAKMN